MHCIAYVCLMMLAAFFTPCSAQPVDLAQTLFDGRANLHPAVMLTLDLGSDSLRPAWPESYAPERNYEGYFDFRKCYGAVSHLAAPNDYFVVTGNADQLHECAGAAFSGNFMNWASMSMFDMLHYALSGGLRALDLEALTVLKRADIGQGAAAGQHFRKRLPGAAASLALGATSSPVNRVTPFTAAELHIRSCGTRLLFSDVATVNNCDQLALEDYSLGSFSVAVQVCTADESFQRSQLCKRRGTNYKPEGVLQRYAQTFQIGLMASSGEQGRVLVPVSYVGEHAWRAPDYMRTANPLTQWHPDTGVRAVPDSMPGVSGIAVPSLMDALIRAPSVSAKSGAILNLAHAAFDYFRGTSVDVLGPPGPPGLSCRKNFVALISDDWLGTRIANPLTGTGRRAEAARASDSVKAMERDSNGLFLNPAPRTEDLIGKVSLRSWRLAEMAFGANLGRSRGASGASGVYVKTVALDIGQYNDRTAANSPLFLAAKYGGFDDWNGDGNPFVSDLPTLANWSDSAGIEWDRNRDGIPDGYRHAANGTTVVRAVQEMFAGLAARVRMSGDDAQQSAAIVHGTQVFSAGYESRTWSGNVQRLNLPSQDPGAASMINNPVWQAKLPALASRKIYTLASRSSTFGKSGAPAVESAISRIASRAASSTMLLDWTSLSHDQQQLLAADPEARGTDAAGPTRLAWLAGDARTEEGAALVQAAPDSATANPGLRRRFGAIGDVMQGGLALSLPQHIAAPIENVSRPPTLFVAANDGLLHALYADTGAQLWAYMPSVLLRKLPQLAAPAQVHASLLDGGISVTNARIGTESRTVLTAGLGRSTKGLFVLDVTNPVLFAASGGGVLFEFTSADDPDIGHILSAPQIGRLAVRNAAGKIEDRDFIVVQSGVNGVGALFLLALDKDPDVAWQRDLNYFKIELARDSITPDIALGPLTLVNAADLRLAYAYAGDLNGDLWRFRFLPPGSDTGMTPRVQSDRIFVARDMDGKRQPVSSPPRVAYLPGDGFLILFGTGKLLEHADAAPGNFQTQSYYALHDRLQTADAIVSAPADHSARVIRFVPSRASLALRTAVPSADGSRFNLVGDPFSFGGDKLGWFFDFPASGERVVSEALINAGSLHFSSLLLATDPCVALAHRAWHLELLTGLAPGSATAASAVRTVGTAVSPPMLVTHSSRVGPANALGQRLSQKVYSVIHQPPRASANDALAPAAQLIERSAVGRLGWREISNWQQLRERAVRGRP